MTMNENMMNKSQYRENHGRNSTRPMVRHLNGDHIASRDFLSLGPVSYTNLDVYKRQAQERQMAGK